jgi:serine/threonine protein kinase
MIKCPKDYKIPTNDWLRPIKVLIDEYNLENSKNLIYDSELIEDEIKKERVLVKVSKVDTLLNTTEEIYKYIKDSEHIVKIYCFLHCNEYKTYLNQYHKNTLGFCNSKHTDKDNQIISLEIMKRYSSSLRKYEGSLKLKQMIIYLKYLLLIQIELFNKYGFVHNDIHLGNILLKKIKKPESFKFIFNDNEMEINTKKILVLTDFEESLIISKENRKVMLQFNKCKYIDTLESNIYNTFSMAIELLKSDKEKYELSRILNKNTINKKESTELFVAFCNKTIKIKEYKKRINKIVIDIIILLFKEMFNKSF